MRRWWLSVESAAATASSKQPPKTTKNHHTVLSIRRQNLTVSRTLQVYKNTLKENKVPTCTLQYIPAYSVCINQLRKLKRSRSTQSMTTRSHKFLCPSHPSISVLTPTRWQHIWSHGRQKQLKSLEHNTEANERSYRNWVSGSL